MSLFGWLRTRLLPLATGEGLARISNMLLLAYVARSTSLATLAAFTLAQNIVQYVMQANDFGLKYVGARFVASGELGRPMLRRIQRRRFVLGVLSTIVAVLYAAFGPVPGQYRLFFALFIASVLPTAMSLDWVFWGKESFKALSFWRGGTAAVSATVAIVLLGFTNLGIISTAIANSLAYSLGALLLWRFTRDRHLTNISDTNVVVRHATSWTSIAWLGAAAMLCQMFNTIDSLILAAKGSVSDLAYYNAAYKIIFLILGGYYLVNQALYPKLARHSGAIRNYAPFILLSACSISLLGELCAPLLIRVLFGAGFQASVPLLRVLLIAVPFDALCSFYAVGLMSLGNTKALTLTNLTSAGANIALNLWAIPRFGAMGAAWSTSISYLFLMAALFTCSRSIRPSTQSETLGAFSV